MLRLQDSAEAEVEAEAEAADDPAASGLPLSRNLTLLRAVNTRPDGLIAIIVIAAGSRAKVTNRVATTRSAQIDLLPFKVESRCSSVNRQCRSPSRSSSDNAAS